jgi:hypothetical protein
MHTPFLLHMYTPFLVQWSHVTVWDWQLRLPFFVTRHSQCGEVTFLLICLIIYTNPDSSTLTIALLESLLEHATKVFIVRQNLFLKVNVNACYDWITTARTYNKKCSCNTNSKCSYVNRQILFLKVNVPICECMLMIIPVDTNYASCHIRCSLCWNCVLFDWEWAAFSLNSSSQLLLKILPF